MLSENQIIDSMLEYKRKAPAGVEDNPAVQINLLIELIRAEQGRLSAQGIATLLGLGGVLMRNIEIPKPDGFGANGEPLWDLKKAAEFLGKTEAELKQQFPGLITEDGGQISRIN